MLEDHKSAAVGKCDIRLCKSLVIQEFKCTKCGRACHQACCKGLISEVKDKPPLPALPEGSICHTKKCCQIIVKDASSSQRGDWKTDGKPETPTITFIKLLLDWWTDCPKHEMICGKGNDRTKKTTVCKELAQDM